MSLNSATLHQLKIFEVVARHLSFTRAAEELFLTQPSVSVQIKQLTRTVGLPLFEQIGKRLYLTDAGQKLYTTCQEIFEQLDQCEMAIADLQGLKQGQLRLVVLTTTKYFLPRFLGPFCDRYPGIEISLKFANHERVLQYLKDNQADLYMVSQLPETIDIVSEPILENPLVVLAPQNHPLTAAKNISLQQLAQEPFILREPGSGTRKAMLQQFDQQGLEIKVRLELSSNEAIKQAIIAGLGLSVLSRHTLALEGTTGPLRVLDVEGFPIQRHWYVIYPAKRQLSIIAQSFLTYLLEAGQKDQWLQQQRQDSGP